MQREESHIEMENKRSWNLRGRGQGGRPVQHFYYKEADSPHDRKDSSASKMSTPSEWSNTNLEHILLSFKNVYNLPLSRI